VDPAADGARVFPDAHRARRVRGDDPLQRGAVRDRLREGRAARARGRSVLRAELRLDVAVPRSDRALGRRAGGGARMTFEVAGDKYDRYMGRYSRALAPRFVDFAGVREGPVLDVGCGPGALSEALAARLGAGAVFAVDPSEAFAAACRARVPGADVR